MDGLVVMKATLGEVKIVLEERVFILREL